MSRSDGIALVLVLWVLVILSVIVGQFGFAARSQINITRNFKDSTQGRYLALAGHNQAIYQILSNPEFKPPKSKELDPENQISVWRINADNPIVLFGEGSFKVRIDNASGKVNINLADRKMLKLMLNNMDMDDTQKDIIVDSIMDWRDQDHMHRINGAEDEYYSKLGNGYECKDDVFDSVEELLYVRGITAELYHHRLKQVATVYPKSDDSSKFEDKPQSLREKNERLKYNKINVNAASRHMWLCLPEMTETLADAIDAFRQEGDIVNYSELTSIIGLETYQKIRSYLTFERSAYFTIHSVGAVDNSQIVSGISAIISDLKDQRKKPKTLKILEWKNQADQRLAAEFRAQRKG